jgi:hypothetical protein
MSWGLLVQSAAGTGETPGRPLARRIRQDIALPTPSLDHPAIAHKRPLVSQKESPAFAWGRGGARW